MAKVTITIEDVGDKVKVVAEPNFETLMAKDESGHKWTSAEGMALWALNRIREESKRPQSTILHLPTIGR